MDKQLFLITGCARSGTLYMSKALNKIGLDFGHETLGKDGSVSGGWNVKSDSYPLYHQQGERPKFDIILHQVREPLATIASVTTGGKSGWEFVCNNTSIMIQEPLLVRCAKYWLYWNRIAQKQSIFTYRIENLQNRWVPLMKVLGVDAEYERIAGISKTTNSREHREVTWNDLENVCGGNLVEDIKCLAKSYGYTLSAGE